MWAHDFSILFQPFITHNLLYHYAMVMQFSALSNLMDLKVSSFVSHSSLLTVKNVDLAIVRDGFSS